MDSESRDDSHSQTRYYKSRTADEWRAYHREYYRHHADRRREQKRISDRRRAIARTYASLGRYVPKRVIQMLLREELAALWPKKSAT